MKMKYRRNKSTTKVLASLVVLALAVVLISFDRGREVFENIASPLIAVSANANNAYSALSDETKSRDELTSEIEDLKKRNKELLLENLNQQFLKEQNKELKEQLGSNTKDNNYSLARVIAKPPITPFDSLTLEIGNETSVTKGQRVRITELDEIGTVSSSTQSTAIVTLYTTSGKQTPVEINGTGPLVLALGVGGGTYQLHIPRSFKVKPGDVLTRPGMEDVVIGIVEDVEKSETDSFSLVRARLPINLFEVTWVYVEELSEGSL